MTIMLDEQAVDTQSSSLKTLGDALDWLRKHIKGTGRIIVKVEMDGQELDGQQISDGSNIAITDRAVRFATANQKDLSMTLLGKLHALVTFLGQQHQQVAGAIEKGQQTAALKQLTEVLTAWQQVHMAYSGLVNMLKLDLATLPVGERTGQDLIRDFSRQLSEIAQALANKDMVLLGDILQYEMDSAIENWNQLLAATLGAVDPDAGKDR